MADSINLMLDEISDDISTLIDIVYNNYTHIRDDDKEVFVKIVKKYIR